MPESTGTNEPVIDTLEGIIGDVSGKKPKFQIHYRPIERGGKPIIPSEKIPGQAYDNQGKPTINPLLGEIVDVEV